MEFIGEVNTQDSLPIPGTTEVPRHHPHIVVRLRHLIESLSKYFTVFYYDLIGYGQISRPVLILWGREDTWIPIEKGEVLHEMILDSLFHVIPDAGHLVIEEQPYQLIEKIRPFLQNEPIT